MTEELLGGGGRRWEEVVTAANQSDGIQAPHPGVGKERGSRRGPSGGGAGNKARGKHGKEGKAVSEKPWMDGPPVCGLHTRVHEARSRENIAS